MLQKLTYSRAIVKHVKSLDTTRPTTIAISYDVSADLSVSRQNLLFHMRILFHSGVFSNISTIGQFILTFLCKNIEQIFQIGNSECVYQYIYIFVGFSASYRYSSIPRGQVLTHCPTIEVCSVEVGIDCCDFFSRASIWI